jgi:uncharacterized protein involved in tolerance to divalent cations
MNENMDNSNPVFVNIPCPTKDEAVKLCGELLRKDLCGTAKIHDNVHLMYTNSDGVQGDDVVLITLKTIRKNLVDIHEFILKNHSWGTPCIEAVPILSDMC